MSREIIAILRGLQPQDAVAVGEVLMGAGITQMEVPLNSPNPFESVHKLSDAFGVRAKIGAGTVLNPEDVQYTREAGGTLILAPNCNPAVIKAAKAADMAVYPGVFTITECFVALQSGADGLKLFPADLLGTGGFQAMRAVLPNNVQSYAVGGTDADSFKAWMAAGVTGFGIGSALFTPDFSLSEIQQRAQKITRAYDEATA